METKMKNRLQFRKYGQAALLAVAAILLPNLAAADTGVEKFPTKPIKLVVPYPPGGTPDILARIIGAEVSNRLGQQIIVDNRSGAGGNIGAQGVAREAADGYSLLMCAFSCATVNAMYRKPPYDTLVDFKPVVLVGTVPSVLVVNPAVPAQSIAELLALAKARPDGIASASSGTGSSAHLATALLNRVAGVQFLHVPYRGAGNANVDLLAGQVQMYFDNLPAAVQNIRSGKLRALAVASAKRSPTIPDVPTFTEAGVKGFLVTPWFGVLAPAKTPDAVLEALNKAFNGAMQSPAVKAKMTEAGVEIVGGSRNQFAKFLGEEVRKWGTVIRENNIVAD
jgi:tripartite-type tricarboxylate transporter receptor subunit TctC